MSIDAEIDWDDYFLSYPKILKRLKLLNVKTKNKKNITSIDLVQAINIMEKKHPLCRWKFRKKKRNQRYILIEGFYWLLYVYFQREEKLIDAEIRFFTDRIKQYENLLSIHNTSFWNVDLYVYELETYFNRSYESIRKAILKMNKEADGSYKYIRENKYVISKQGIEWLCKNHFKHKYLELLEIYKMELSEKYMEAGYIYDNF